MEMPLFGRSWSEALATLRGLWLWLRLGRLLDFFSTFVFASHICKCATKGALEERAVHIKAGESGGWRVPSAGSHNPSTILRVVPNIGEGFSQAFELLSFPNAGSKSCSPSVA
jgi:hypothetical protein